MSAKLNSGAHDCCFVFAQGIAATWRNNKDQATHA